MNPAALPDVPIQVPIDNPNEDTEWNDILRKHKIIPEKPPSPTPILEAAIEKAQKLVHEHRLDGKDLDELDELEDLEDEEFLEIYKQKRRQELSILASKAIHGKVYPISKPDYSRAVTDASKQYPVLLHLASSSHGNLESRLLSELWRWAAEKFPEIKFCEIVGSMCIENYPDKNCPTILVYKDGELEKNSVGLGEMKGSDTRLSDLEAWMVGQGVLKGDDIRLRDRRNEEDKSPESHGVKSGSSRRAAVENDSDDDWD